MDEELTAARLAMRIDFLQQAIAEANREIWQANQYAAGLMQALLGALPLLLKQHPATAEEVMRLWGDAEWERGHILRGGTSEHLPDYYEAPAMLFRVCKSLGVPTPSDAGGPRNRRRSPPAAAAG